MRFQGARRAQPTQFIHTGSSLLTVAGETIHSGTSRFATIKMRTLSLYESGESNGSVSVKDLFEGKAFSVRQCGLTAADIAYLTCRGGWPWATLISKEYALDQAFDYVDSVIKKDIQRVNKVKHSAERAKVLLRSYARNISQQVSYATI